MKHRVDISRGVKVGSHQVKIKASAQVRERLHEGSFYGRCYHTANEILVDNSLPQSKFNETVIHEIIERVDEVYCSGKVSHRNITGLANGLTQAFDSLGISFTHKSQKGTKEKRDAKRKD